MVEINKTKLNKFKTLIEKNKIYLDSKDKINSDEKKYSIAISMSILMEYYSLNQMQSYSKITDGGDDNKIDAFYYSDDEGELGELIIIQSKYKKEDAVTGTFLEDDITLCINSCKDILKGLTFQKINKKLGLEIKNFRKLLTDNNYPKVNVKMYFATNGIISNVHKELSIINEVKKDNIECEFIDATNFGLDRYAESGELIINLKDDTDKTDSIFNINDPDFSGFIGSCSINDLVKFYENSGKRLLLNSNVRYLIKKSDVNEGISKSFKNEPKRFAYLNNGISIICKSYSKNLTGHDFTKVIFENPSIVNGGQTISTLYDLKENNYEELKSNFNDAKIIIRCYKVPPEYSINITKATNSQNPINPVDLKSNDKSQNKVKEYFEKKGVGFITKKGEEISFYDDTITNESLLQIYASLYGDEPGKAKLSKAGIFKKYYDLVFIEEINEEICKKLYRCYSIQKYIENCFTKENKSTLSNAIFSIIYTMKILDKNILNQNIPDKNIQKIYAVNFKKALSINDEIINEKSILLKEKFSLNNLYKGNEIKDLIDIKITDDKKTKRKK